MPLSNEASFAHELKRAKVADCAARVDDLTLSNASRPSHRLGFAFKLKVGLI